MTLPPDDAAYGHSFAAFVLNPIVLLTGLALAITFGFLGFIDSLWSLAGADLRRAIPITILVTVISVAATATKLAALCGPAGLVAGMVSMRACRFLSPSAVSGTAPSAGPYLNMRNWTARAVLLSCCAAACFLGWGSQACWSSLPATSSTRRTKSSLP